MSNTADDAERRAMEEQEAGQRGAEEHAASMEVRPEEFTQGMGQVSGSAWSDATAAELARPLDPNRIRSRSGRGSGKFEYLAGHDVKRRATQIFGFGNWGHTVVELRELGSIEVATSEGKQGWHIGYMAHVRIWVNTTRMYVTPDGVPVGRYETDGVGYGDGVEYGPAAFVTSRELAIKEAETDAMKRAFTDLGDQFGLILYAKADEKKRIQADSNAEQSTSSDRRSSKGAQRGTTTPRTWAEIFEWADAYGPELGWPEWVKQASFLLYGKESSLELTPAQKKTLGQKASGAIIALREAHDPATFPPPTRGEIQRAWASVLDAQVLPGPEWRLDPSEAFPTLEELTAAQANGDEDGGPLGQSATSGGDDIPWPGETDPTKNALDT